MSHRDRRANFVPQRIAAARAVPSVPVARVQDPSSDLFWAVAALSSFSAVSMIAESTRRMELMHDNFARHPHGR